LEVIEGFVFKGQAVLEAGESYSAPIFIKAIGTAKEAAEGKRPTIFIIASFFEIIFG